MSAAPTLTWEQYQQLPPELRKRPLTSAEYAALSQSQLAQAGLAESTDGAPANFNGPVFPNPNHVQPSLDTDSSIPVTRLPEGVSFQRGNFQGNAQPDISNPPAAEVIPEMGRTVGANMSGPVTITPDPVPGSLPGSSPVTITPDAAPSSGSSSKAAATPGFWETLQREGKSVAGTIAGVPASLYHAFSEPPTQDEANLFANGDKSKVDPVLLGTHRLITAPVAVAGKFYADAAKGKYGDASAVEQGMLENAPEAIGEGAGTVLAGRLAEEAPGAARTVAENAPAAARAVSSKPALAKVARVASDVVDPELTGIVSPRLAYAQKALGRLADVLEKKQPAGGLDATGENKPFAGGMDEATPPKPQPELDATGENKPFAGGMDEAPPAQPVSAPRIPPANPQPVAQQAAPAPRTVVLDPETGRPEFSDVIAAKAKSAAPDATVDALAKTNTPAAEDLLAKLSQIAKKIQSEEEAEPGAADEDLIQKMQDSIAIVNARKALQKSMAVR